MTLWIDSHKKSPSHYSHTAKKADLAISLLKTGKVKSVCLGNIDPPEDIIEIAKTISQDAYHGKNSPIGWSIRIKDKKTCNEVIQIMKQADHSWHRKGYF